MPNGHSLEVLHTDLFVNINLFPSSATFELRFLVSFLKLLLVFFMLAYFNLNLFVFLLSYLHYIKFYLWSLLMAKFVKITMKGWYFEMDFRLLFIKLVLIHT